MFWDKISPLYDVFENVYNYKVYSGTGKKVAEFIEPTDEVLECACGTGAITVCIAEKCRKLIATDFAPGMLKQAARKTNMSKKSAGIAVKFVELLGADFKKQFDFDSYKSFFMNMGYDKAEYHVVDGRMPCAIAVITKA